MYMLRVNKYSTGKCSEQRENQRRTRESERKRERETEREGEKEREKEDNVAKNGGIGRMVSKSLIH